jgi:hypothetical protein
MKLVALDTFTDSAIRTETGSTTANAGDRFETSDTNGRALVAKRLAKAAPVPQNKMAREAANKADPSAAAGSARPSSASPAARASASKTASASANGAPLRRTAAAKKTPAKKTAKVATKRATKKTTKRTRRGG